MLYSSSDLNSSIICFFRYDICILFMVMHSGPRAFRFGLEMFCLALRFHFLLPAFLYFGYIASWDCIIYCLLRGGWQVWLLKLILILESGYVNCFADWAQQTDSSNSLLHSIYSALCFLDFKKMRLFFIVDNFFNGLNISKWLIS